MEESLDVTKNDDSDNTQKNNSNKLDFKNVIEEYIKYIECQINAYPLIMNLLSIKLLKDAKTLSDYFKNNKDLFEKEDSREGYLKVPLDLISKFENLKKILSIHNMLCY